jgi:hypothetical protein
MIHWEPTDWFYRSAMPGSGLQLETPDRAMGIWTLSNIVGMYSAAFVGRQPDRPLLPARAFDTPRCGLLPSDLSDSPLCGFLRVADIRPEPSVNAAPLHRLTWLDCPLCGR